MLINIFGIKKNVNKYQLLKFFNRKHLFLTRYSFAILGYIVTFLLTRSKHLALASFNDFLADDFKIAFRRGAKLVTIYNGQKIARDDTFNFCEDLNPDSLHALKAQYLKKISKEGVHASLYGDYLYVLGGLIEHDGQNNSYLFEFNKYANKILNNAKLSFVNLNADDVIQYTPPTRPAKLNLRDAYSALHDWSTLIPINDLKWFIISGTFLGMIREGGFLKHDYDIDFGVFDTDFDLMQFEKIIEKDSNFFIKKIDTLKEGNFKNKQFIISKEKRPLLIKLIHRTGINLDLFIHYTENRNGKKIIWHGSSFHKWINSFFELKEYTFIDISVLAPKDYNMYLSENYGDWKTPVTEFHFTTGTPNLKIQNNPSSVALFLKRISELRSYQSWLKNYNVLKKYRFLSPDGEFYLEKASFD